MATQQNPSQTEPEKREGMPPSSDTRAGLDHLGEGVSGKRNVTAQIQELLAQYKNLSGPERMRKIGAIISAATLGYLFGKKKEAPKPATQGHPGRGQAPEEVATVEGEGAPIEEPTRERRRRIVCNDKRLILINTDPVAGMVPKRLKGNASYLLEYGLPEFDTFVEEMIGILAPDTSDRQEALKQVVRILKSSPMGKFQCMPSSAFNLVGAFKKYNFQWGKEGQEEEKLHAMWEFLQSEAMQKEAARAILSGAAARFGGDPQVAAASYYGGDRAAKALQAYKAGTATPEQKELVEKKQGAYVSILEYSQTSKSGAFDIETELARTAARESGTMEGKKSKPRDAAWEQDQRYAYNHAPTEATETQVA